MEAVEISRRREERQIQDGTLLLEQLLSLPVTRIPRPQDFDEARFLLRAQGKRHFEKISRFQQKEGKWHASINGDDPKAPIADDKYFLNTWWKRDCVRTLYHALDPRVRRYFPEFNDPHYIESQGLKRTIDQVLMAGIHGVLRIHAIEDQFRRLQERPVPVPHDPGRYMIDDLNASRMKGNFKNGRTIKHWGHFQVDQDGDESRVVCSAINQGYPVLTGMKYKGRFFPGEIISAHINYVVNLNASTLVTHSIWEHGMCWIPTSSLMALADGLEVAEWVYPELIKDSQQRGYNSELTLGKIQDARGKINEAIEKNPTTDYTDPHHHPEPGDSALLIFANNRDDYPTDRLLAFQEVTANLRCGEPGVIVGDNQRVRVGMARFRNDPWKLGYIGSGSDRRQVEAVWTLADGANTRLNAILAQRSFNQDDVLDGLVHLQQGLQSAQNLDLLERYYGWIPELLFVPEGQQERKGNNNDLAMGREIFLRSDAALIDAICSYTDCYNRAA